MREAIDSHGAFPAWMTNARSLYVYGFEDTEPCRRLLRLLTGDSRASVRHPSSRQASVRVTDHAPEMAGPLSGMRVSISLSDSDRVFELDHAAASIQRLVGTTDGDLFLTTIVQSVTFYLNASLETVDLSASTAEHFDVKRFFCSAVPITMYVKWAFQNVCWTNAETSGCLVVDDPLLKPRYGFMHFKRTEQLMDDYNFATTVAFIPWNWRRTNAGTVRMMRQRPDRFSLCVHGCDHTHEEFAVRSTAVLNSRIKSARHRMDLLFDRTSLRHDRIMVFPQSAFSPETGRALKLNGFVAAASTDVAPAGGAATETTIGDLWSVAIMKYGTFPIFTRRYMTQGIENFAFDGLVGKPCLMVAHHEAFRNGGLDLAEFISKLNALNWTLRWRSLGDAVRHSLRRRQHINGSQLIQMYAGQAAIENRSADPCKVVVLKEESDGDYVNAVTVDQEPSDFAFDNGCLRFGLTIPPKQTADVRLNYVDNLTMERGNDPLTYRIKVGARRFLCEVRDNYLSRNDWVYERASRLKQFLIG
jgi:hypothetical protein